MDAEERADKIRQVRMKSQLLICSNTLCRQMDGLRRGWISGLDDALEPGVCPWCGTKHTEGLYGKYIIKKANGDKTDPNAKYFVLRLDTDIHARRAAHAYIESVRQENPALAEGLTSLLAGLPFLDEPGQDKEG